MTKVNVLQVLILEHEALARWGVAADLRSLGYRVVEAHSVHEAISVFESGTPIDVVFCDLDIPGDQSGLDFTGWLTRNEPAVPVVLTSVDAEAALLIPKRPTLAFIVKPYAIESIVHRMRLLLSLQVNGSSST